MKYLTTDKVILLEPNDFKSKTNPTMGNLNFELNDLVLRAYLVLAKFSAFDNNYVIVKDRSGNNYGEEIVPSALPALLNKYYLNSIEPRVTDFEDIIGLSLEDAKTKVKDRKIILRVVVENEVRKPILHNHEYNRLNVATVNGIVTQLGYFG